jgi:hypothetical protein
VHTLLELAWNDDPLTTLKLILNMTKLLRERSYFPLVWLYHYHPRTLAFNVRSFADCSCLKDFSPLLLKLLGYNDYSQEEYEYKKIYRFIRAYYEDAKYHFLYNRISDVFSDLLKSDLDLLKSGNLQKITLLPSVFLMNK